MTPDVMTPQQAADYLQLNVRSLYSALKTGQIPARRIGRQWRISRRVLDAWMSGDEVMEDVLLSRLFAPEIADARAAYAQGESIAADDAL